MAAFLDNVRFNPTAGGTTDWTYSSAVTGYQSPSAGGVVNGTKYKYFAISADSTQWEIGEGAYNTSTGALARTTVLYNSSGTGTASGQSGAGTKISFGAAPQVAIVGVKEDLISVEEANSFSGTQQSQARTNIGAGTVTSVAHSSNYGISVSGSPVTASGTINTDVSLTKLTNVLASDIAINVANQYFDGPSVAQGSTGVWFAIGTVSIASTTADVGTAKLHDGTNIKASTIFRETTSLEVAVTLGGIFTSPPGNIRISVASNNNTATIKANGSGVGADSHIDVFRLA
jgi:hypothetical protein